MERTVQTRQSPVEPLAESITDTARASLIRVLMVDDDACLLKTSKPILEKQGAFHVDTTSCVEEAWEKTKTEKYDAVVCDYQMPGKDGLQFLEELRKSGEGIPFILFTGKGREEVAIRALNLGADRYINKQGSPETVYGELAYGVKSVVARHKAEEALRSSEEKYRAYVENSPVAFFVINSERKYEQVNDAACKLLGHSKEELLEMTTADVVFEKDTPLALKHVSELNETGKSRVEFKLKRKNGEPVHVILNTVKLSNGKMIGFCEDITERKKAEEALQESEKRYRTLFNAVPLTISITTLNGKAINVNNAIKEMSGYTPDEFLTKNMNDIYVDRSDREKMVALLQKEGKVRDFETRFKRKDGAIRSMLLNADMIVLNNQTLLLAAVRDITEHKNDENKLRESEQRFRCLVECAAVYVGIIDLKGQFTYVNKALADSLGYSVRELTGRPFKTFLHPDDRGRITRLFPKGILLRRNPRSLDFRVIRKDGHFLHWMTKPTRFAIEGKTVGFQAIITDITERDEADKKLE